MWYLLMALVHVVEFFSEGGREEEGGEGASHIIVVVVFLIVEVVAITFALASVYKDIVSLANRTRYAYIA